jgi:hypothetical protein
VAVARAAVDVQDALVTLLRRAPYLEVQEVIDDFVGPVLGDLLAHLAVVLVPFRPGQVIARELVVISEPTRTPCQLVLPFDRDRWSLGRPALSDS